MLCNNFHMLCNKFHVVAHQVAVCVCVCVCVHVCVEECFVFQYVYETCFTGRSMLCNMVFQNISLKQGSPHTAAMALQIQILLNAKTCLQCLCGSTSFPKPLEYFESLPVSWN